MVDIEKILKKRKPTAKDTLNILLNDIIAKQINKTAKEKGTLSKDSDPLLMFYKVVLQEDYSKVVLKLDSREYEKHQKNVKLYNLYYELIEDMEKRHDQIIVYFNCLTASLDYDVLIATLGDTLPGKETGTGLYIKKLQQYIAENIRAIKGYICFVDALKQYTKNDLLEITKTEVTTINQAYKDYVSLTDSIAERHPDIYNRYTALLNDEYINGVMVLSEWQKDTITEQITDELKGLETPNGIDLLKTNIYKSSYIFIREGESQEKIKAELDRIKQEDKEHGIL